MKILHTHTHTLRKLTGKVEGENELKDMDEVMLFICLFVFNYKALGGKCRHLPVSNKKHQYRRETKRQEPIL